MVFHATQPLFDGRYWHLLPYNLIGKDIQTKASSANIQMSEESVLSHVQNVWAQIKPSSPIYHFLLSDITITRAAKGSIQAELRVGPNHTNSKGVLHGTVSACLVDWASSLAVASTGADKTGVSTDLHTSYVSTAREGDLLVIEGKVNKIGTNLAFTTVEISTDAGVVVAHGVHTKFVRQQE